jgi:hypothetical protein
MYLEILTPRASPYISKSARRSSSPMCPSRVMMHPEAWSKILLSASMEREEKLAAEAWPGESWRALPLPESVAMG